MTQGQSKSPHTYETHGKGPGIINKATLYSAALSTFQNTLLFILFDLPNNLEREATIIPIKKTRKLRFQDNKLCDLSCATHSPLHMLTQGLPLTRQTWQVSIFVLAVTKWQLGSVLLAPTLGLFASALILLFPYLCPQLFCSTQLTPPVQCIRQVP